MNEEGKWLHEADTLELLLCKIVFGRYGLVMTLDPPRKYCCLERTELFDPWPKGAVWFLCS